MKFTEKEKSYMFRKNKKILDGIEREVSMERYDLAIGQSNVINVIDVVTELDLKNKHFDG